MRRPTMEGPFERREDGPWWARVTLWVLTRYGLPTVLAIAMAGLLIWFSVGDVKAIRSDVSGTRSEVAASRSALQQHNDQMLNDARSTRELHEMEIRILQAMCYNAAKSDAARTACSGK